VRIHIVDEHGQGLGSMTDLRGALGVFSRAIEHDPGVAEMHLRSGDRIAIAVVLSEAECFRQPSRGIDNVLVSKVGQQDIRRHGAILQHGGTI
jgi:hypothetical protein